MRQPDQLGPFRVGDNIYFAQSIFQGAFDVIQVGILDANAGIVTAQGQISLPNEDLLYPPSAGATLPVAMLQ